jgi:polyisoprenoid-binding protein YceI
LKNVTTGITLRDEHTKKHLEVDKYPEAVLVSATGKDGKGEGVVKIHGVERSVKGTYEINNDKLTANFPLKLSEFGIEGIKYMGVGVQDEVQLTVTVPVQVASAAGAIEATPKATTGAAGSAAKKESKAK